MSKKKLKNKPSTALAPPRTVLIMPLLVVQRSAHGVALDHQFNQCFYQKPSKVNPPSPSPPKPTRTTTTSNKTGHVQFTSKIEEPLSAVDRQQHQQALDFTMSKFKASSAHPLYRQFYGAGGGGGSGGGAGAGPDESPPYEKHEEQDNSDSEIRDKPYGKFTLFTTNTTIPLSQRSFKVRLAILLVFC